MVVPFTICSYKTVAEDGRMLCSKIVRGDREVTAALCASCPAVGVTHVQAAPGSDPQIAPYCRHLRFSLEKEQCGPIIIRYGNGKTVVWDERPPVLRFARAACAMRLVPLCSVADCLSCPERSAALPRVANLGQGAAVKVTSLARSTGKVIPLSELALRQHIGGP